MTLDPATRAQVDALFAGALRISHARLARFLVVKPATLAAEGDRRVLAFQTTPTGRRLYTREAVLAYLARADEPPPPAVATGRPPPPPKRRRRQVNDASVIDFQQKLAARRAPQP